MPLRWDSREGRFLKETEYVTRRAAEIKDLLNKVETYSKTDDERIEETLVEGGLVLKGEIEFSGEIAVKVRNWLNERGYKDFRYDGSLQKILPEDKVYGDWVKEALYWYARACGMLNEPGEETKVRGAHKSV